MIARDISEELTIVIKQEDHADLAAQCAMHWGNKAFYRPEPHISMVTGTANHDSHFRDIEWVLPVDSVLGRPLGHRETPSSPLHLRALERNVAWLGERDLYASLLVSMHHTGLAQNRYGVIKPIKNGVARSGSKREMSADVAATVKKLEAEQELIKRQLGLDTADGASAVRYNYHVFQTFDLISLYLCCDGYEGQELCEMTLDPVPLNARASDTAPLRMIPLDRTVIRLDPYPFDVDSLNVSLIYREMERCPGQTQEVCKESYWRSKRGCLSWTFVP